MPESNCADLAFARLPLAATTLANLSQLGYAQMTPVQAASLPPALAGRDLIVQAETGSGKTAAFGLALLAWLNPRFLGTQALVLCPTRELADQVAQELRRLARGQDNVKTVTLCGGVPLRGQTQSLQHGAHIVVGTPGRVLDHLQRGHLDLQGLRALVLDEADRMLDMGFADDMAAVARHCPAERQTLLFSATYPEGIGKLAQQFLRSPLQIRVAPQRDRAAIAEHWYEVDEATRLDAVVRLLQHHRPDNALAFCNTKQQCRDLVAVLRGHGFAALALSGELEQVERDQVLVRFANRSANVLVATDVAARGLDIARLAAVVNVDVTPDPEVHVHRIGRTGRAGESGLALNLASMDEMGRVGRIEQARGQPVQFTPLASLRGDGQPPAPPPMATLQIAGGRKQKIRAGDVLGALAGEAGLTREQVGRIDVNEFSTYVAVAREIADETVRRLDAGRVKGRSVKVRRLPD
ncbi:ATP-dependent RNA helicase DbpA [Pseudorhodoferax sp.]|uniref:ATP-dependent RNA helicase DbpA n=1 Tax=Pseudorhodoferax sp. TaxID=1993553 RepID=UPI0039E71493